MILKRYTKFRKYLEERKDWCVRPYEKKFYISLFKRFIRGDEEGLRSYLGQPRMNCKERLSDFLRSEKGSDFLDFLEEKVQRYKQAKQEYLDAVEKLFSRIEYAYPIYLQRIKYKVYEGVDNFVFY